MSLIYGYGYVHRQCSKDKKAKPMIDINFVSALQYRNDEKNNKEKKNQSDVAASKQSSWANALQ